MDNTPKSPATAPARAPTAGHGGGHSTMPGHSTAVGDSPRRSFLVEAAAAILGGLVAIVPLAAGLGVYLDPLRRKKAKGSAVPITTLDKLPDASKQDQLIGIYKISANRQDAWNLYPNEPVGSVYLVLPKGKSEVVALNGTCPHLGCFVDVNQSPDGYSFLCPCHTSAFHGDGSRIMPCVSPRDMDSLVVRQNKKSDGTIDISVEFENFQPGLAEKKPKT